MVKSSLLLFLFVYRVRELMLLRVVLLRSEWLFSLMILRVFDLILVLDGVVVLFGV